VTAIGRARECEIHLADPNVSRRHAEIHFDAGSYAVVDLGSTNGTELNGQRIKNARLSDGDVIAIGQTELTFVREVEMALASTSVDGVLLALKIAFIVLLYLFIWRVVRAAGHEMQAPQDSFVTAPLTERHEKRAPRPGALVVVSSPDLEEGERLELTHEQVTIGRGPLNDLQLLEDDLRPVATL